MAHVDWMIKGPKIASRYWTTLGLGLIGWGGGLLASRGLSGLIAMVRS
ncbi:MAG: hypothetical protein AAF637_01805 [Pseudomonadota bacterium]